MQPASECGSDARTHLQRGVLGAQGLPAADCERAHQEFPDDGVERDVAVVNVNGGLGLGDSAAAHVGEKPQHQEGQNQPREGGHHDHAHRPGSERRAQQPKPRVIDGDAETHHCEPGKKPDDHRKQQKKIILAHRQQSANAVGDSGRRRGRGRAKAGAVGRTGRRCRRRWEVITDTRGGSEARGGDACSPEDSLTGAHFRRATPDAGRCGPERRPRPKQEGRNAKTLPFRFQRPGPSWAQRPPHCARDLLYLMVHFWLHCVARLGAPLVTLCIFIALE